VTSGQRLQCLWNSIPIDIIDINQYHRQSTNIILIIVIIIVYFLTDNILTNAVVQVQV